MAGVASTAVYYWNESLHSESVISNDCCPTPTYTNTADPPSYDDYEVVWRSTNNVEGGTAWMLWSGAASEIPLSIGSDADLYAGTVAYVGLVEGKRHIMYWDGEEIHQITQGRTEGYSPSLHEGKIAFERWDGHDWEMEYWNGSEVLPVTDNDFNDTQPSLHGNLIAWVGRPESLDQIFYTAVPQPDAALSARVALALLWLPAYRRRRVAPVGREARLAMC